jgi:hypothetical protein
MGGDKVSLNPPAAASGTTAALPDRRHLDTHAEAVRAVMRWPVQAAVPGGHDGTPVARRMKASNARSGKMACRKDDWPGAVADSKGGGRI